MAEQTTISEERKKQIKDKIDQLHSIFESTTSREGGELLEKYKELQQELNKLKEENKKKTEQIGQLNEQLQAGAAEDKDKTAALQQNLEDLKQKHEETTQQLSGLQEQKSDLSRQLEEEQKSKEEQLKELTSKLEHAEKELAAAGDKQTAAKGGIDNRDRHEKLSIINALRENINSLTGIIKKGNITLSQFKELESSEHLGLASKLKQNINQYSDENAAYIKKIDSFFNYIKQGNFFREDFKDVYEPFYPPYSENEDADTDLISQAGTLFGDGEKEKEVTQSPAGDETAAAAEAAADKESAGAAAEQDESGVKAYAEDKSAVQETARQPVADKASSGEQAPAGKQTRKAERTDAKHEKKTGKEREQTGVGDQKQTPEEGTTEDLSFSSGTAAGDKVYTLIEKIENSKVDIHSNTYDHAPDRSASSAGTPSAADSSQGGARQESGQAGAPGSQADSQPQVVYMMPPPPQDQHTGAGAPAGYPAMPEQQPYYEEEPESAEEEATAGEADQQTEEEKEKKAKKDAQQDKSAPFNPYRSDNLKLNDDWEQATDNRDDKEEAAAGEQPKQKKEDKQKAAAEQDQDKSRESGKQKSSDSKGSPPKKSKVMKMRSPSLKNYPQTKTDVTVNLKDDDYEKYGKHLKLTYLFDNMPADASFSKFKQPLRNACRITLLGNLEEGLGLFAALKEQRLPVEYKEMIDKNIRDVKYYLRGKFRSSEADLE